MPLRRAAVPALAEDGGQADASDEGHRVAPSYVGSSVLLSRILH